ncbi:HNH endonuclease [[Phormidium] sp. ETS-05]|uniref:HNH endonuclease n=1 Tax=[Phormidium] sp. ETS-05 TaxID=222819 RepID=UPI0018EEEBC7|nr:HNH endonuclease [[Phormidium] sp. ETS-05]
MSCQLCNREVNKLTLHHLIPKQKGGKKGETIEICSACHHQIHALFDNTHLAQELNSIEKLQNQPQFGKFLDWVRKQNPDKRIRVHGKKAGS